MDMSSDSAKENIPLVFSSVTERKQDLGNSDDPERSSFKANEESNPTRADKEGHSHCHTGLSTVTQMEKLYNTKYFIIKSLNHQNISLSVEKGIWATQVMNEPILEEAFHNSGRVILIFSVNMSGSFQGYAQMMSSIGRRRDRDNIWSDRSGKSNPWGRSFKVKWLRLYELPFHKTIHLKNPLNDYKPVKISRDCQELSPEIGLALCELLDGNTDSDDPLSSSSRDSFSLKGQSAEIHSFMAGEDCNFPPQHSSWSMSMPYPSVPYHNLAEVNIFHSANHIFSGSNFTGMLPSKRSHLSGNIPKLQVQRNVTSELDVWGLSAESPLASTLTEDDFLDMSYEEYLEVHDRCRKKLCSGASKLSRTRSEPSRSNSHDDDRNLNKPIRDRSRRILP